MKTPGLSWLPRFVCPECDDSLEAASDDRLVCPRCGATYERRELVWRFLAPSGEARLAPFVRQYRVVRDREGRRNVSADEYRQLPAVPSTAPHATDWSVRRETYRHLLGHVLACGPGPSTVLDVGAGCGWLAHRLARLGHQVVALDVLDDDQDGLGAVRHYDTPIVAVQADFDRVPLASAQFDLVVFNGSLHYAPDPGTTLMHAHRLLADGGTLAVMDSPMFHADRDGTAMVADLLRRFARDFGLRDVVQPGCGYLTFASLDAAARRVRLASAFVPSRGPLACRVRRQVARVRLGRRPAAFGLWVAR